MTHHHEAPVDVLRASTFAESLAARPPILVVDDRLIDPATPAISAFDRGLLLGDGVFDTMLLAAGAPFQLDAHVERLARSAAWLGILDHPHADRRIRASLTLALGRAAEHAIDHGSIRTTITRGPGAPGLAAPPDPRPTLVVAVQPSADPTAVPAPLCAVVTTTGRRNERSASAAHKTLGYVDAAVALADARTRSADDAIFLDTVGTVACGTASNVILVLPEGLVTPPSGGAVLPGVTRAVVLALARSLGVAVQERSVAADELSAAVELWLTSSIRGIAPVVRLDGRPVGTGAPGPLWHRIQAAYVAMIARARA